VPIAPIQEEALVLLVEVSSTDGISGFRDGYVMLRRVSRLRC
jgi:hypothetical protein